MAANLSLLKSFVDGQGAGAATYVTYAEDHDSNYLDIENGFNALNAEVQAFAGNNAVLVLDLVRSASPALATGFIGADSFAPVAFISADTQVQIPVGVALTSTAGRIPSNILATLTGGGSSGARFVALNADGSVTLETAALQGVMDLYSVNWNGASFDTGTLTRLEEIMVDGDDFQNQKIVLDDSQSTDAGLPAFTYDVIADRLNDIQKLFLGLTVSADAGQGALNGLAISGTVALPWVSLSDGTSVFESDTGLFRAAADEMGVSVEATELMRWAEQTANEPQLVLRAGTALGDPPFTFSGDRNTGIGWVSANIFRAVVNGIEAARFGAVGTHEFLGFVGDPDTGSNPGLAVIGDLDTGLLSEAANQLQMMTNGVTALVATSVQQINSATQGRVRATRASFSLTNSGTLTNIDFDTEDFDQGGWFTATSADFTMPTGFTGPCMISGEVEWPAGNLDGIRHVAIEVNGAAIQQIRVDPASAGVSILNVMVAAFDVTAAQVIRLQAAHTDTSGALNIRASIEISRIVA